MSRFIVIASIISVSQMSLANPAAADSAKKTTYADLQNLAKALFGERRFALCQDKAMALCHAAKDYFKNDKKWGPVWNPITCGRLDDSGKGFCMVSEDAVDMVSEDAVCAGFGVCLPRPSPPTALSAKDSFLINFMIASVVFVIVGGLYVEYTEHALAPAPLPPAAERAAAFVSMKRRRLF